MVLEEEKEESKEEVKIPTTKWKRIFFIIICALLTAGAGGGAYVVWGKKGGEEAPPPPKKPSIGPTVSLDNFVVNLNEQGGNRYLKVGLELEFDEALDEETKRIMPRLRDQILVYLSSLKVNQALRVESKQEIKKKMLELAESVYGANTVKAVYFKEFVMQ